MIRKFAAFPARCAKATILVIALAASAALNAQQTSPQPAPAEPASGEQTQQSPAESQQSGSQETSQEVPLPQHKVKAKEYKDWNFNVGGGANLTTGTTQKFVRSGGGVAEAGVAHNYSPYFGFRLDFQFDNLPLRQSALRAAQAPGATSHAYTLMLDPIINIPVTKLWSGYIVFGAAYMHRSGKLDSSTALPGAACNTFFDWWGSCYAYNLPLNGKFLNASQNEYGYNFGGGVARKVHDNIEVYGEFRLIHGKANGITTDFRPITIGVRW
ncbi:MAG: outer membrane beta-barrel protein [Candidatus Sulfotelmatobacter sp.]